MATAKALQLKFKNLNVGNFLNFLDSATAGKFNHTFEFDANLVQCRAFPQDKKFVKYTACNSQDILRFDALPAGFESIKVPIYAMDRLKSALKVIEDSTIDDTSGFIEYIVDEKNGGLTAININFKAKKISNKVKATDAAMFSYLDANTFASLAQREEPLLKFDIDRDFRMKLTDLFTLEGENIFTVKYTHKDKKLVFFAGDSWEYEFTDAEIDCKSDFAYDITKEAITRLSLPLYSVTFKKLSNGYTNMVAYADDMNIVTNYVVIHDPNKPAAPKK